jgi:hypothetical protein
MMRGVIWRWTERARFLAPLIAMMGAVCSHGAQPNPHAALKSTPSAASPRLVWELPAGWEETQASGVRLASFSVKGLNGQRADIGIAALPGQGGGDISNVNRWRQQVGLPATNMLGLASLAGKVEIAGQTGRFYEMAGQNPSAKEESSIIAGILEQTNETWLFKMNGDDELVAAQKGVFLAFLKSLRFQTDEAPSLPPSEAKPNWKVPSSWQEITPGQTQLAKFLANVGRRKAEISVVVMAGEGGGALANVNRWREQMGLSPIASTDLSKETSPLQVGAANAVVLDVTSPDTKLRLVAVSVPGRDRTWFYKLAGDEPAVAREKEPFLKFVQSAAK